MSMTISPPPEIKRSYPFVDLTKYIAAVMVIMIHTNPLGAAQDSWLYTFTYTILRNALPFFFLSSSYFFFKKRNWSKYNIDSKRTSYMRKCSIICYFSQFPIIFMCGVLTKYLPFGIDFANFVITIVAANILSYMIIRYSDCYAVLKNLY